METVSADDPRLEPYRKLQERDLVGRQGGFMAEGEVVLRVLVDAVRRGSHQLQSVLLSSKQAGRLGAWLRPALPAAVPVLVADDRTLEATLGFELHRGILALASRTHVPTVDELLSPTGARTVVALFGIGNHDNVGGIFRNLAAFGVDAALLDTVSCDPHYRKAIRVSVGGVLRIPFYRGDSDLLLVERLAHAGYELIALSPGGATTLQALTPSPRRALLLGAEGPGLSADVLARCRAVRLDMAAGFDSLNVATTSGIALYALRG